MYSIEKSFVLKYAERHKMCTILCKQSDLRVDRYNAGVQEGEV